MIRDTWHVMSGSHNATCQVQDMSNKRAQVGPLGDMWQPIIRLESKVDG